MFLRALAPKLALLVALTAAAAAAAGDACAADAVFPPASRVGLVPPPGFVLSTRFSGFEHADKQASILVGDLPGFAFEAIAKQASEQAQTDPALAAKRDLALSGGGRGFVLAGQQSGPQGPLLKWTMVATQNDVTAVVSATVPEGVKEALPEEAVMQAFASVAVRPSVPVEEQLSVLPFSMGNLSGLRIVRVQPGAAVMLTDGPSDAVEIAEQALLMVSLAPLESVPPPEARDGLARRLLSDIPGVKDTRVVRAEPLRVAGQQGYELLIEAKDAKTGGDVSAVQWLRFGTTSLLRMVGMARKEAWEDAYKRFRDVRDGIGPR